MVVLQGIHGFTCFYVRLSEKCLKTVYGSDQSLLLANYIDMLYTNYVVNTPYYMFRVDFIYSVQV